MDTPLVLSSNALVDFVVASLATFEVARLIAVEKGPFDVFRDFRTFAKRFTKAIECTHCVGFWVAIVVVFLLATNFAYPLLVVLAIAGANTLLQIVSDRLTIW